MEEDIEKFVKAGWVNANGEIVINIDPYEKTYEYNGYNDYCHKYEQFIEQFHGFENKVYQYVENL